MRLTKVMAYGVVIFIGYNLLNSIYQQNKPFIEELLSVESKIEQDEKDNKSKANPLMPIQAELSKSNPSFIEKKLAKAVNIVLSTSEGQKMVEKIIKASAKEATGEERGLAEALSEVSYIDVSTGKGEAVHCGQTAQIFYDAKPLNGTKFEDNKEKGRIPVIVTLGEHKVIRGLELAIIGMKKISQRRATIPPVLGSNDPNFAFKQLAENSFLQYNIELIDVEPSLPNLAQLQIFDKMGGIGRAAHCGDKAIIHVSLSDLKGKKIYSSKDQKIPKTITIGHKQVPYAITVALEKMRLNGVRSVLTPAEFLNNIDNKSAYFFPEPITFANDQMVMLEIELLKIEP